MGCDRYVIAAGIALLASTATGGERPVATAQPAVARGTAPSGIHPHVTPRDGSAWNRDPFQHQKNAGKTTSLPVRPLPIGPRHEMTIQGIMKVDGNYYALVNGRVVKAGDRIERTLVENVSRYRVVVKDDSGRRNIDIYAGETPKR